MLAISAVDWRCGICAASGWASRCTGCSAGRRATTMPAYASMLGFSVARPRPVRERAIEYKDRGYRAQKWFFRHGPGQRLRGVCTRTSQLVRTLREAVGDDYDLMFDCWQSMDVAYVTELAARIAPYRPRWLEEVVMPDRIDGYRLLRQRLAIPLAGAEHEYTRWGFRRFVDAGALDVLQPDMYWCGGLSEALKIAAYATAHDLMVIPHGHSAAATLHFSLTQSPAHTPYQEDLVKWNQIHQFFLADPVNPVGWDAAPQRDSPGLAWSWTPHTPSPTRSCSHEPPPLVADGDRVPDLPTQLRRLERRRHRRSARHHRPARSPCRPRGSTSCGCRRCTVTT